MRAGAGAGRTQRRRRTGGRLNMVKGTRGGILQKGYPRSLHGQVSWDVYFTDVDDPDGQARVARVGPEAVMGHNMEPGDRIQVKYLLGVAVKGTRIAQGS